MNKSMKKHLETVVDAIINEDTKKASVAFHSYLNEKTKEMLDKEKEDDKSEDDSSDDDKYMDESEDDKSEDED